MKNFWRLCFVLLADKLLRNGQRRLGGASPPSLLGKGRNCDFFFSSRCCSISQPAPGGIGAHTEEMPRNISVSNSRSSFCFRFYFFSLTSNSLALSEEEKKREREKKKIQKVVCFFFKQKKRTYKLPYQLASQGCQTHLAPKETQKKKQTQKNQNPKFIFITAKVFFSWSLHPGLVWMSVFDFGFDFVKGRGAGVGILGFGGLGQEETFRSFLTGGQHPGWAMWSAARPYGPQHHIQKPQSA